MVSPKLLFALIFIIPIAFGVIITIITIVTKSARSEGSLTSAEGLATKTTNKIKTTKCEYCGSVKNNNEPCKSCGWNSHRT